MKLLHRIDHLCAVIEKAAAVILFTALALLLFFNIIFRSLLGISFHTILEFVPTMVLWLALIGSGLALRQGRHIKIELLLRFCSPSTQRTARRLGGTFGMLIMGVLFVAGLEFVCNEIAIFGPTGALSAILPIFFCGSFFRFLLLVLEPDGAPTSPSSPEPENGTSKGAPS